MALFDLFGIGSSPDYLSGFLSEEERRRLQERAGQNALLQAGLSMLGSSGYSTTPVPLGQILGSAGQAGLAGYQGTLQQGAQDLMMRQKFAEMKRNQDLQKRTQEMIGKIEDPQERLYAELAPEQYVAGKLKPKSQQAFALLTPEQASAYGLPSDKGQRYQMTENGVQLISGTEQKEGGLTTLDKLIAARDKLKQQDPNNPNIAFYNAAIKKETEFAPPMQVVTLPQPMEAINPKTGRAELVQFPNRPGMQPQFTGLEKPQEVKNLKPFPVAQASAVSGNATAIAKIDKAIAEVENAPDDSFGAMNYVGNAVRQRTDPAGNKARSSVAAVGSQKFHDLSGAAVSATEASRLTPYIPQTTDTKENILQKLRNMKAEYQSVNDQLLATYSEEQGYKPLNVNIAPIKDQSTTKPLSAQDKQALDWANANPKDPRAKEIKRRLGQ